MTVPVTLGGDYFDAMYEAATDPWGFEDRWYESASTRSASRCFPNAGTAAPSSRAAPSAC